MYAVLLTVLASSIVWPIGPAPSRVTFHLMQIEQVIGGVNGDTSAQAIQLRLRFPGETGVQFARLRAWDSSGTTAITLIDFDTGVPNGPLGGRVLITSTNFAEHTDLPLVSDFTMTNLIPEEWLAAGRITYEQDTGAIFWSLAYGGAAYTGPTTGLSTNDDDGDFGPQFDGPLPSTSIQGLKFQGDPTDLSSTNADDYALTPSFASFINNKGSVFRVIAGIPTVSQWGVVILVLLLATTGTLILMRRQTAGQSISSRADS